MSLSHEYNFFFLQTPRGLLPRLKSRFWCSCMTSGQTTVQKELCRKSHEKWGLPCPVLQFLSWPSCATAMLAPLCYRPVCYSQLLLTPDLLSHHEQGRGQWGHILAVMSPSLSASFSSSAVGWPWSLEQSALDEAWWNSAVSSDTGGLNLTLIASLRNHFSNLCGLFLLA